MKKANAPSVTRSHNGARFNTGNDSELKQLLTALTAFKRGDFSVCLPDDWTGVAGKVADTFNDSQKERFDWLSSGYKLFGKIFNPIENFQSIPGPGVIRRSALAISLNASSDIRLSGHQTDWSYESSWFLKTGLWLDRWNDGWSVWEWLYRQSLIEGKSGQ